MSVDDDAGELVAVAVTRIEEDDFVRAYREVPALRGLIRAPLVVLPGLAVVVGACVSLMPSASPGTYLPVTAVLFLVATGLAWWRSARMPTRQWRALPEWQRQNPYEVRRRRFRSRTEKTAHDLAYEEMFSWLETASAFYLEQAPAHFIVLPKHAFESSAAIDAAREVFTAAIKGRAHPPKRPRYLYTFVLWVLLVAMFVTVYHLVR